MTAQATESGLFCWSLAGRGPRHSGGRTRVPALGAFGSLLVVLGVGCSDVEETRTLPPRQVGITAEDAPIYDDGELTIYEAKHGVPFPLLAPSGEQRGELGRTAVQPFPTFPWVEVDDLRVQVSWIVSNLDPETHTVSVLIDPWNEFGRYWPGLSLVDADDGEYLPNLSGYERLFELPGTEAGTRSRVSGTATYDDMREMAIDLSTVMQLIETPPTAGEEFGDADLLAIFANHAFHRQNRAGRSPLVDPYQPAAIAGLTGIDIGLRTFEPANIALEVVVELVRVNEDSPVPTQDEERERPLLRAPEAYITVGTAP